MFLSYDTIGYLKGPDIALVKDVETGTVAVRKKLRAELLGVYERLKSVEQANLPRVYETEEYEGECFAYYEYIEGETLEDIVHEGKYTIAQAEEWMEQLCAAMGALHAMQPCVVHRDIKPENILMVFKDENTTIKVTDFGLAKHAADGLHTVCGTPQYFAPEIQALRGGHAGSYSSAVVSETPLFDIGHVVGWRVAFRVAGGGVTFRPDATIPTNHAGGSVVRKAVLAGRFADGEGSDWSTDRSGAIETSDCVRGVTPPVDS